MITKAFWIVFRGPGHTIARKSGIINLRASVSSLVTSTKTVIDSVRTPTFCTQCAHSRMLSTRSNHTTRCPTPTYTPLAVTILAEVLDPPKNASWRIRELAVLLTATTTATISSLIWIGPIARLRYKEANGPCLRIPSGVLVSIQVESRKLISTCLSKRRLRCSKCRNRSRLQWLNNNSRKTREGTRRRKRTWALGSRWWIIRAMKSWKRARTRKRSPAAGRSLSLVTVMTIRKMKMKRISEKVHLNKSKKYSYHFQLH